LFTVRNPYSWLLSLFRKPYHMVGRLPDDPLTFIRRPWITLSRELTDGVLPSPIDLWNIKTAAIFPFKEAAEPATPCRIIHFEALLSEGDATLRAALADVGVDPTGLSISQTSTRPGLDLAARQTYEREQLWAPELGRAAIAELNARIDWDVAGRLGYSRIDPADAPERPLQTRQPSLSRLGRIFGRLKRA
jgi:hypothetical protein